jgi:hypothetical protein
MSRRDGDGACEACSSHFGYYLVHNGFNDSAYAYCDTCGVTALFDGWSKSIPEGVTLEVHGPIATELEPLLRRCECGGRFIAAGAPRCPKCRSPLDPDHSAEFLERNAPGTAHGWRWQRTWQGLYAIVIEDRSVTDPWLQR